MARQKLTKIVDNHDLLMKLEGQGIHNEEDLAEVIESGTLENYVSASDAAIIRQQYENS